MKNALLPMTVERADSVVNLAFAKPTAKQSELAGVDLNGVNLRGSDLSGVDLRNANLIGADLKGANLSGADLRGATLSNADLRGATLHRAMLSGAALNRIDLRGADLSNTILSGANLWDANLSGASLDRANLWDVNLSGANLSGAELRGAILSSANLRGANLSRTSLWGTNLTGANLHRANLTCADLSSADLSTANLLEADLSHADFNTAIVEETRFGKNPGLSSEAEQDLKQRGASFTDARERKYFGSSRFEGKNSITPPPASVERLLSAPIERLLQEIAPAAQMFLPEETTGNLPTQSDEQMADRPFCDRPVDHSVDHAGVEFKPEGFANPDSRADERHSDANEALALPPSTLDIATSEDSERSFYNDWQDTHFAHASVESNVESNAASNVELKTYDSNRYVSPVARAAASIRSRQARLQATKSKDDDLQDSLTRVKRWV
ncbi:MAG TPA: pentapeptide repeat-containing protein [Crinalium sp.]